MDKKSNKNLTIKNWSEADRPREKLLEKGKKILTDAELLGILIGSGNRNESAVGLCKRILSTTDNNLNSLAKLGVSQLTKFKGIGEAKAITIVAALELGRRQRKQETPVLPVITSSNDVFNYMQPLIGDLSHEEFWVLFINNANKVLYRKMISSGGRTGTIIDNRIIFKTALEYEATAIVLAHNHPSGKLEASKPDINSTNSIVEAGRVLNISVLDHLIITEKEYFSFADNKLI